MALPRYWKIISLEIFCLILFSVECLIKYSFINKIPKQGFYLFGGFLQIVYAPNRNLAFSLPLAQPLIIILILAILGLLSYGWIISLIRRNTLELLAFTLIIFGALSNLIDRLLFGYVLDYMNVFFWPVFNLADAMIVVGVGLYILSEFKIKTKNVNQT